MTREFGIFTPVFETAHGYLALLGLHAADAPESVASVRDCCRRVPDPFPDVCRLLGEVDWRPHLVGTVAVIICGYHDEAVRLLWRRLDTGSWVTPQIGVALSMVDPEFLRHARERLEARCPVDSSDLRRMTPVERHSAAGPAGTMARSAKAAQTLLYLVQTCSSETKWLEEIVAADDFQGLLREDFDGSDEITESWSQTIRAIISSGEYGEKSGG